MEVQIFRNREYSLESSRVGTIGENRVEKLVFTFPEEFEGYKRYIEFSTPEGSYFEEIKGNEYIITNAITKYEEIKADVVLKKDDDVFISKIFALKLNPSIGAEERLEEEKKSLIDTIIVDIEKVSEKLNKLEGEMLNFVSYDDTEVKNNIKEIKEKDIEQDQKIENKVNKEEGKGLSSNDFTNAEGESIHLLDSSNMSLEDIKIRGNTYQKISEQMPSPEFVSQIKACGENGNINIEIKSNEEEKQTFSISCQKPMFDGDYFTDNGEHHKMQKIMFDGKEDWGKDGNVDNDTDYFYLRNESLTNSVLNNKLKCSHFKKSSQTKIDEGFFATIVFCIRIKKVYTGITTNDDKQTRINKFKKYLSDQYAKETPVMVVYEAEEEEVLPLTEKQNEALEKMKKANTYKGETIINSPDEVSPNIEVTYKKDIETVINNLTEAIVAIGGVN